MSGRPVIRIEHGEYGYARRERCKCEPCLRAARRYAKRRSYDAARGVARTVPAEPVRAHLQSMIDGGISCHQLAKATGGKVNAGQIRNLMTTNRYGNQVKAIYRETADVLMTIKFYQASTQAFTYVSPTPTRRRVEGLRWMGWPVSDMADRLDLCNTSIYHYLWVDRMRSDTEAKVESLYRQLWVTRGPSDRERFVAYRSGFLPPMAWDDQAIRDPYGIPDLKYLTCVVCARPAHENSLCLDCWAAVEKEDGFANGRRFRRVVEKLMKARAA